MKQDLQKMILDAKRELRQANGLTLSAEEEAAMLQDTEMDEMKTFVHTTVGLKAMFALNLRYQWVGGQAAAQMTVDDSIFQLRKSKGSEEKKGKKASYSLFALEAETERELAKLEGEDPHFTNRLLLSIDRALPESATSS